MKRIAALLVIACYILSLLAIGKPLVAKSEPYTPPSLEHPLAMFEEKLRSSTSSANGTSLLQTLPSPHSLPFDNWPCFHHDPACTGFTLDPGPPIGEPYWRAEGSFGATSAAVVNGLAYFAAHGGYVRCFNASTGEELWRTYVGTDFSSNPAYWKGHLFIGTTKPTQIACLNATTGALIWNYSFTDPVYSSPQVWNGRLYIGVYDGCIYCFNATTGALLWQRRVSDSIDNNIAIVDGYVYTGSDDGYVYCLDAITGAIVWQFSVPPDDLSYIIEGSPCVAEGRVFIGCTWEPYLYCLNATTGQLLWSTQLLGCVYTGCPAYAYNRVYVGSSNGHLYCLNATTGEILWIFNTTQPYDVWNSPALFANGTLVAFCASDDHIYCLNATTGELIWKWYEPYAWWSPPAVSGGSIFITSWYYAICLNDAPPAFSITHPTNGSYVPSPVTVEWVNHTYDIAFYEIRIQAPNGTDTGWLPVGLQRNYTFICGEGWCTVWVRATDAAGHTTVHNVTFCVDPYPPSVEILYPSNHTLFEQLDIPLQWNASDNLNITTSKVFVDGKLYCTTETQSCIVHLAQPGQHNLTVVVFDPANSSAKSNVIIAIDLTAPCIYITHPTNGTILNTTQITL